MATYSKGTDRKGRQGEEERVDPSKEGGEGPTWETPVTDSASSGLAIADCAIPPAPAARTNHLRGPLAQKSPFRVPPTAASLLHRRRPISRYTAAAPSPAPPPPLLLHPISSLSLSLLTSWFPEFRPPSIPRDVADHQDATIAYHHRRRRRSQGRCRSPVHCQYPGRRGSPDVAAAVGADPHTPPAPRIPTDHAYGGEQPELLLRRGHRHSWKNSKIDHCFKVGSSHDIIDIKTRSGSYISGIACLHTLVKHGGEDKQIGTGGAMARLKGPWPALGWNEDEFYMNLSHNNALIFNLVALFALSSPSTFFR
ncbi:uncharacterized protein LOC119338935 [Triticum dicoccoides]|uniref:uncharacterized protein LOC119338935 n=1 Tax=Triticum dicoccoides TaxID=85692 RepID=UPI001890EAE7|nr:uncharacterized protein LOC119338935 [Triticum dicoccoides]